MSVVGSVVAILFGSAVTLAAAAWHYLNAFAASLSCPPVNGREGALSVGGWMSGSTCGYGLGGDSDSYSVHQEPLNLLAPRWSLAAFLVISLGCWFLVFLVCRHLYRWARADAKSGPGAAVIKVA